MKTIEDYKQRGVDHARNGTEKAPYQRSSNSWQARAYWEARDTEAERLTAFELNALEPDPQPDGIRMERMAANTAGWPQAAAEHARLLALMANDGGPNAKRYYHALSRLQRRHMNQQPRAQA
ncbi:hypothetical protein D3C87_1455270 [compost metagenome]